MKVFDLKNDKVDIKLEKDIQNFNKIIFLITSLFFLILISCNNNLNTKKSINNSLSSDRDDIIFEKEYEIPVMEVSETSQDNLNENSNIIDNQSSQINKFFDFTISEEYYELSKEDIEEDQVLRGSNIGRIKEKSKNLFDQQRLFYKKNGITKKLSDGLLLGDDIKILPSPLEPSTSLLNELKSNMVKVISNNFTFESVKLINSGEIYYNKDINYNLVVTKTIEESITKFSHQYVIKIRNNSFIISIDTFENIEFDDIFKIK